MLVTSARMDDVVDTTRQYCAPLNFRTDGVWIWTEASAYYAQEHLLEPDPAGKRVGLRSRHARLAVNTAVTWCNFMLDTLAPFLAHSWRTRGSRGGSGSTSTSGDRLSGRFDLPRPGDPRSPLAAPHSGARPVR